MSPPQVKDIFGSEMTGCGSLNFSLNVPEEEVRPHYTRLVKDLPEEPEPAAAPAQPGAL